MPIHFQSNLRHIRKAYDLNQKAMSGELGINWKAYQSYELGRCEAPYEALERIYNATGFRIDELVLYDLAGNTELIDVLRRKRVKLP